MGLMILAKGYQKSPSFEVGGGPRTPRFSATDPAQMCNIAENVIVDNYEASENSSESESGS